MYIDTHDVRGLGGTRARSACTSRGQARLRSAVVTRPPRAMDSLRRAITSTGDDDSTSSICSSLRRSQPVAGTRAEKRVYVLCSVLVALIEENEKQEFLTYVN